MEQLNKKNVHNLYKIIVFGVILYEIFTVGLTIAFSLFCSDGRTLAIFPNRAKSIEISATNVPDGAYYMDILIPMRSDDPYYSDYNQYMGQKTGLPKGSAIANFYDKGYISYSFHMKNATTDMVPKKIVSEKGTLYKCSFGLNSYAESYLYNEHPTHLHYIQEHFEKIRVAILNQNGDVLAISDTAFITPPRLGYLSGEISYDCSTSETDVKLYENDFVDALIMSGVILPIILTMFLFASAFISIFECIVAFFYKLKPIKYVFL